jgi:hypothetical protein
MRKNGLANRKVMIITPTTLDLSNFSVVSEAHELNRTNTPATKTGASIKDKLDALNRELRSVLDGSPSNGAPSGKKRKVSAAAKRKIAAARRARWAKLRRA